MLPDHYMLISYVNNKGFYRDTYIQAIEAFEEFPWEQRIEKAFFRGAMTGFSKRLCP